MADNASDVTPAPGQTDAPADHTFAIGDELQQLMDGAKAEQDRGMADRQTAAVQDAIKSSQEQFDPLAATYSERNSKTGEIEQFDLMGNKVGEGLHPSAAPPKDPATDDGKAPPPAPPPAPPTPAVQQQQPAQPPAAPQQTQQTAGQQTQQPDPRASHSAQDHAIAQARAEIARLTELASKRGGLEVNPDLSDEPQWDDEDRYPTAEAAQEARRKWYSTRYQAAVAKAVGEREAAINHQIGEQRRAIAEAQARVTHGEIRTRMNLDEASYATAVNRYAAITHPGYNQSFKVRNPIGNALINAVAGNEQALKGAGVDFTGRDGVVALQEAQFSDPEFAQKLASLPISQSTANMLDAVAHQPRVVGVLRHLLSGEGQADLQRVLAPNLPPQAVEGEIYRIAAALPADQKQATTAQAAAPRVAQQQVPALPTPGRSAPATRTTTPDTETSAGLQAMFDKALAEADKAGTNGWGYM